MHWGSVGKVWGASWKFIRQHWEIIGPHWEIVVSVLEPIGDKLYLFGLSLENIVILYETHWKVVGNYSANVETYLVWFLWKTLERLEGMNYEHHIA